MKKAHNEVSKFLSYVLRHQPQAIGLELDSEGWANIDALIAGAAGHGQSLDKQLIEAVVQGSDKKRFALSEDGLHIRAVQGHSTTQVDIAFTEKKPPDILYHGTASHFLSAILAEGLTAQSRQYVHLSADREVAIQVGQRYGTPVVLEINALAMFEQGYPFYQAENGVWLTRQVAVEFIGQ
ncbi:putative RNA 2'-phosphotransferase [Phytobacter palmae]|nr:putative RNA 2'-phosphotransferase [Phytobacter palmae]